MGIRVFVFFLPLVIVLSSCQLFQKETELEKQLTETVAKADVEVEHKNYGEAIRLYDSALRLVPNEPTCLSRRAVAYRKRGTDQYNASIKLDKTERQPGIDAAKRDFLKSGDDSTTAVNIIKRSPYITFFDLLTREQHYLYAVSIRADCLNVVATTVDNSRADEALNAIHEYIDADTDAARILQMRLIAGKMLLNTGNGDKALAEYRTVLDADADNIEGLLGVGLALSQSGDAEKFHEAKKYLKRFLELAPDDHPMKADIVNTLKYSEHK
jgi:tetratricopeptide (TPR) repeat protein